MDRAKEALEGFLKLTPENQEKVLERLKSIIESQKTNKEV